MVPFAGIALGVAGVVIGIIAVVRPTRLALNITGIALSTIAIVTGLGVLAWLVLSGPVVSELSRRAINDINAAPSVSGQTISTPCYRFEGPRDFINNQPDSDIEDCFTKLQLWGEIDPQGNIRNTGVGSVLGTISVEPVNESTRQELSSEIDLDAVIETLNNGWLQDLGTVTNLKEPVSLDGEPANVTRIKSPTGRTKTKAAVVGFAPDARDTSRGEIRLFVVTITTPYDNGEQLIEGVVTSWKWR
ncbi:hypothetical protein [Diaminobutyricibacter sp. McL0608]|uniref:hypothetical protein n=1 Tax=Leifsonia sp. McL0608 TaxID=3143537 RepID=UPI0031F2ED1E